MELLQRAFCFGDGRVVVDSGEGIQRGDCEVGNSSFLC